MPRAVLSALLLLLVLLAIAAGLVRLAEPRMAFFPFPGEDADPARYGVPFEAIDVRTSDGERLRAWWLPHEQPRAQVVYFHGNGGNLSVWSDILIETHRRGFSVLAVDYRGYGLSSGSPSERGLYLDAEATLAVFHERLRRPGAPVVYWGRSLGTAVAAFAASRRRPDGVVLEAGFRDARTLTRDYPILWVFSWFSSYRFSTAGWLRGVRVPALVMHGTSDGVVSYRQGQWLFESLEGDKRFFAIEGADHNDARAPDAEGYWRAVNQFVSALPRS
jgi:hypothetical protein